MYTVYTSRLHYSRLLEHALDYVIYPLPFSVGLAGVHMPPPQNERRASTIEALEVKIESDRLLSGKDRRNMGDQKKNETEIGDEDTFRAWRHNPCLMRPVSALMLFIFGIFTFVTMLLSFPGMLLGLMLRPIASRLLWIVEFWYPLPIGRSIHFGLLRLAERSRNFDPFDKNKGFHSRATETRIEVVQGRLYIHILPQLLDNLGYLVVCIPPNLENGHESTDFGRVTVNSESGADIVAFVVDCGNAEAVMRHIELVSELHYRKRKIQVQAILSTHKHWDHTAGNVALQEKIDSLRLVVGGAAEGVPGCNHPVGDGDLVPLPVDGTNDMGKVCEVRVVATPAHTRGSVCFVLIPKANAMCGAVWWTGDTMFHGGGGVPFEADLDKHHEQTTGKSPYSAIKATASAKAVERCFSQLLYRTSEYNELIRPDPYADNIKNQVLVLVGHEYTVELLQRQITNVTNSEANQWKLYSPEHYFATASSLYVSMHRRTLPSSNGKLLAAPTLLKEQLLVNPQLRSLQRRAEIVAGAIRHWNDHFCPIPIPLDYVNLTSITNGNLVQEGGTDAYKSNRASPQKWNLSPQDVGRSVFCTVYAAELEQVIQALDAGTLSGQQASLRLKELRQGLRTPAVTRRPIPGTLLSDGNMYKSLVGLILLGSPPTALAVKDAEPMNLDPPMPKHADDRTKISRRRLICNLKWFGLVNDTQQGQRLEAMLRNLWEHASECQDTVLSSKDEGDLSLDSNYYDSVEMDPSGIVQQIMGGKEDKVNDGIELRALRWALYGLPWKRPKEKFCTPCRSPSTSYDDAHPVASTDYKQHSGDMVRHDIAECRQCQTIAGVSVPTSSSKEEDSLDGPSSHSVQTAPVVESLAAPSPHSVKSAPSVIQSLDPLLVPPSLDGPNQVQLSRDHSNARISSYGSEPSIEIDLFMDEPSLLE